MVSQIFIHLNKTKNEEVKSYFYSGNRVSVEYLPQTSKVQDIEHILAFLRKQARKSEGRNA